MSDTIYRQDAINVMCNKVCGVDYCGCATDCNEIKGIMELPSAGQIMTATSNTVVSDTVKIPVMDGTTERLPSAERTGEWIMITDKNYFTDWKCSLCGGSGRGDYLFCPNCGARMVKGEEDDSR